jgi:hypothetical protein
MLYKSSQLSCSAVTTVGVLFEFELAGEPLVRVDGQWVDAAIFCLVGKIHIYISQRLRGVQIVPTENSGRGDVDERQIGCQCGYIGHNVCDELHICVLSFRISTHWQFARLHQHTGEIEEGICGRCLLIDVVVVVCDIAAVVADDNLLECGLRCTDDSGQIQHVEQILVQPEADGVGAVVIYSKPLTLYYLPRSP